MSGLVFIYHGDMILINPKREYHLPNLSDISPSLYDENNIFVVGNYQGQICHALNLKLEFNIHDDFNFVHLKSYYDNFSPELLRLAVKAKQIAYWSKTHLFCGLCGSPTKKLNHFHDQFVKECIECNHLFYPRISPCIITLITNGNSILLARSPHFPKGVYSLIAGFIEPGETAEEAVVREVKEEVGVNVDTIEYCSNQAWPFPHSLMIGFRAKFTSGEIVIDNREIIDAKWFTKDAMPVWPNKMSIAHSLIKSYFETLGS